MTQEEKELLYKDLCMRLPYKPKCACIWKKLAPNRTKGYISTLSTFLLEQFEGMEEYEDIPINNLKPYLRPLSSMSDKEREEWTDLFMTPIIELEEHYEEDDVEEVTAPQMFTKSHCKSINWLLERHFDINGLIEKDLAIEVTEENNPYASN